MNEFSCLRTINSSLSARFCTDFRCGNLIECKTLPEWCKANPIQTKRTIKIVGNIFRKAYSCYLFDNIGEQHIIDIGIEHRLPRQIHQRGFHNQVKGMFAVAFFRNIFKFLNFLRIRPSGGKPRLMSKKIKDCNIGFAFYFTFLSINKLRKKMVNGIGERKAPFGNQFLNGKINRIHLSIACKVK